MTKHQEKQSATDEKAKKSSQMAEIFQKTIYLKAVTPWKNLDEKEVQVKLNQKSRELFEAERSVSLPSFFENPLVAIQFRVEYMVTLPGSRQHHQCTVAAGFILPEFASVAGSKFSVSEVPFEVIMKCGPGNSGQFPKWYGEETLGAKEFLRIWGNISQDSQAPQP